MKQQNILTKYIIIGGKKMSSFVVDKFLWSRIEKSKADSLIEGLCAKHYIWKLLYAYEEFRGKPLRFDVKHFSKEYQKDWDYIIHNGKKDIEREKKRTYIELSEVEALENELGWMLLQYEKNIKNPPYTSNIQKTYSKPASFKEDEVKKFYHSYEYVMQIREMETLWKAKEIQEAECETLRNLASKYMDAKKAVENIRATDKYRLNLLERMEELERILINMQYQLDHKQSIFASILELTIYFYSISDGNWHLFKKVLEVNEIIEGGMPFVMDNIFNMLGISLRVEKKEEYITNLCRSAIHLEYIWELLHDALENQIYDEQKEAIHVLNNRAKNYKQALMNIFFNENADRMSNYMRQDLQDNLMNVLNEMGGTSAFLYQMETYFEQSPRKVITWICRLGDTVFKRVRPKVELSTQALVYSLHQKYCYVVLKSQRLNKILEHIEQSQEPIQLLEKVKWGEEEQLFHSNIVAQIVTERVENFLEDIKYEFDNFLCYLS